MSSQLGNIAILANTDTSFTGAPSQGVKGILIGNESGLTCTITMESGGVSKTSYPGTVDWFNVNPGFSGNIKIHPITILNNVSSWPASSLIFDAIGLNDPEQPSMYPLALPRNTNVGNTVNTTGGIASQLVNTGNAAGSNLIQSQVTGDASDAVSLTNDGVFILGDSGHPGSLTMAGNLLLANSVPFQSKDAGGTVRNLLIEDASNQVKIGAGGANNIILQDNAGNPLVQADGTGFILKTGTISLLHGSLSRISIFTGSANNAGTLQAHSLGVKPDFCMFQETNTAGDTNTFSWDTAASDGTNVKVWTANATLRTYIAVAIKL